jgi:hypothetical protein
VPRMISAVVGTYGGGSTESPARYARRELYFYAREDLEAWRAHPGAIA